MERERFLGLVQYRARLDSMEAAKTVTQATLATLAERLGGRMPSNLAAQLPEEFRIHLEDSGDGEPFGFREFLRRFADREGAGASVPDAAFHARAVLSVVNDVVYGGVIEPVRNQLTDDWRPLFDYSSIADPDVVGRPDMSVSRVMGRW